MPEDKDIRGFLSETFADFEPSPERDIWGGIEAQLERKPPRKPAWWLYSAVAAGIAALIAVFLLYPGRPVTETSPDSQNITEVQPSEDLDTLYPKETLVPNEESEGESTKDLIPPAPVISPPTITDTSPVKETEKVVKDIPNQLQGPLMAEKKGDSLSIKNALPLESPKHIAEIQQDAPSSTDLEVDPSIPEPTIVATVGSEEVQNNSDNSKGFSLKDISFEKALLAAGEELDKRFDYSPLTAREEKKDGETVRTFRVKIGGFSITHKKKVRRSKEKRT